MLQYSVNKCVFSRRLKLSLPKSGSLALSGREFQSDGLATEKDRGPSVLSRHRGTTNKKPSSGSEMLTSDTGVQRSVRYRGRLLGCTSNCTLRRQVCTELFPAHRANDALWVQTPRQTSVVLASTGDHTSRSSMWSIYLYLHVFDIMFVICLNAEIILIHRKSGDNTA